MKGYYTGYAYCGIMPDGRKVYFATDQEYKEAYNEELKEQGPPIFRKWIIFYNERKVFYMIVHEKVTYESFDGEIFDDDLDCLNHELNESYERSGIRFTNCDGTARMCNLTDDSYNEIDYIVIDRTKKKENELFLQIAVKDFGWSLLEDLLNGNERKYQLTLDKLIPIKSRA